MRIAAFDGGTPGIVAADDTIVGIEDLLQQYDPLGPDDHLPDLITHVQRAASRAGAPGDGGRRQAYRTGEARRAGRPPLQDRLPDGQLPRGTDRPLQKIDLLFKSPESITGDGDTVVLPPHQADIFHHEAEIAVVIGRDAKDLTDEEAMDAVFGYVAFNDVSARGLGRSGISSFLGKSFDTFGGFGPWIVTKDEIPDPQDLHITVDVNGERRQDYATADMERPIRGSL